MINVVKNEITHSKNHEAMKKMLSVFNKYNGWISKSQISKDTYRWFNAKERGELIIQLLDSEQIQQKSEGRTVYYRLR